MRAAAMAWVVASASMAATVTREGLSSFVAQSPRAKSQEEWFKLMHPSFEVADPAYLAGFQGPERLGLFYNTYIATTSLYFVELKQFVDLDAMRVVRLVNISIESKTSQGVGMFMPAHIVYDVVKDDAGELKMTALRAYWTPLGTVRALSRAEKH